MARITSYPVLSTVAKKDWIPITDASAEGNPLKNVTVEDLQSFIVQGSTLQSVVTAGNTYQTGDTLWRLEDVLSVEEGSRGARMEPGSVSVTNLDNNTVTGLKAGIIAFTDANGFNTRVRQYDFLAQNTNLQWPKRSGVLALTDDIIPSPWGEPLPGGPIIFPPPFSAPSRVGINNTDPLEALDVTGNVLVTGKVEAANFYGQLNGTLNNGTTGYTQSSSDDSAKIATTAFVNNAIAAVPSGLTFKGSWDATSNVPTLPLLTPANGDFWIVSVAGTTNLGGITTWEVGDWAISVYSAGVQAWQKIDNSSVLTGTGTGQMITKWDGVGTSATLADSAIAENNGKIGIGIISPTEAKLEVIETTADVAESVGIKTEVLNTNTNPSITASTYGLKIDTETTQAVGAAANNQAVRATAVHSGISDFDFVVGANISANIKAGGGTFANVYGTYTDADVDGTVTSESQWFVGAVAKARIGNPNHTVNKDFIGASINLEPKSGACNRDTIILNVNAVDAGVFTVAGDYAFLRLEDGLPPTVTGTSRAISSETALPSVFAGSLESTAFIKTSGTAFEFLMADGSVSTGAFTGNIPATQITFGNATSNGITSSSDLVFDDSFKTLTITGTSAFGNTVIKDTSILVEQDASTSVGLSINANAPRVGFTLGNVSTYLNVPTVPTQENIISLPDKSGTVALLDDIGAGTVNGGGLTGYVPLWTSASDIGISGMFQLGDNVGIGTLQPAAQLETTEDILVHGAAVGLGTTTLLPTSGLYSAYLNNAVIGKNALQSNTTGYWNVAVGGEALLDNTEGKENTAVGIAALQHNTTGIRNTAMGYPALGDNTTGSRNTAYGNRALSASVTGGNNTAIGTSSMHNSITGEDNVAVGMSAMYYNINGDNNVAIGHNTGNETPNSDQVTQADNCVFIGDETKPLNTATSNEIIIGALAEGLGTNTVMLGNSNITKTRLQGNVGIGTDAPAAQLETTENILVRGATVGAGTSTYLPGDGNYENSKLSVAFGANALSLNTTGLFNVAVGGNTLQANTTGQGNVAVGTNALNDAATADRNTAIGHSSLSKITTGYNNVAIGNRSSLQDVIGANNVCIGHAARHNATGGNENVSIGGSAMYHNLTGGDNVAIGFNAGNSSLNGGGATTVNLSTFIGWKASPLNTSSNNEIAIGSNSRGLGNDSAVLGNPDITKTRLYGDIDVATGDVDIAIGQGVILRSPNGTKYRITVADNGTLGTTLVP